MFAPLSHAAAIDLVADHMSRDKNGIIIAEGSVEVKRSQETLKTDNLHYDAKAKHMQANGHVEILSPQAHIKAESAELHSKTNTGSLNKAHITLPSGEHIFADRLNRISANQFSGNDIRLSSCPTDAQAWAIRAEHADIDQTAGIVTARNARFEIAGVPVLYTPYWQHPLRRKSGFLLPDIGSSSNRGSEYALPYFWAINPSWDATLTPRWMTARGFMGDIELRHANTHGLQSLQWTGIKDTSTQNYRQHIQAELEHKLAKQWNFSSQVDHVSDHQFLSDFALDGESISTRYLSNSAAINWQGAQGDLSLNGQYHQNLNLNNDDTTLQILPRLASHYRIDMPHSSLHLDQQTSRFYRRVGQDGYRLSAHPWLEVPLSFQAGAIKSKLKVGAQHLRYWQLNQTKQAQISRTAYHGSLEVRSDFESISDSKLWRHAISPIIRYDLSTAQNQTDQVNFDSGFAQLTLNNLLTGSRFSGADRYERMNRISLMIESSLQHKQTSKNSAHTIASARVGVAYDMLRQNIDSQLQTQKPRPFSNMVGEVTFSPFRNISMDASGQYNPVDRYWSTAQAGLRLSHDDGHRLDLRWQRIDARYTTASELLNSNLNIKLSSRWQAFGQAIYDAKLKQVQHGSAGIHYQHACWDFKLEGYRNLNTGSSKNANIGYRFLLGFKGLGSVGDS
ncbi:MAG: LPS assembly protein LptD [Mariprofundaceae bacterium]